MERYDVALVIGAPVFRYYPYVAGAYIPKGMRLLHITDDPAESARAPVGDSLISDAVLAIEALVEEVEARPKATSVALKQEHRMSSVAPSSQTQTQDSLLTPHELFHVLRGATPSDTVLVEETASNLGDLHKAWPIEKPDSFYTFASGSLGWNLPASVGIALAERDSGRNRPVITVIGDGSFQYSVQGLWTAVQNQLPILFVVPENREYGILKAFAKFQKNPGVPGLDIPGLDIAAIAKGYGCEALKTDDIEEIQTICKEAFHGNKPTVLVVPIVPTIPPLI